MKCRQCGQEIVVADKKDKHLCVDCARADRNRLSHMRKNQGDWMAAAKDAGVDTWLQQPGETQLEYTIWCILRDSYPGRKPTYREIAEQAGTTEAFVGCVAQRWTFAARMQAWMSECEKMTIQQRREEIINMNKEHIDMAQKMRDKMNQAIDMIDPAMVKPSEIASLAKLATELERKARVDEAAQEEMLFDSADDSNKEVKKSPTKQGDLSEVVNILLNSGALVGVQQTLVVKKEDNDA